MRVLIVLIYLLIQPMAGCGSEQKVSPPTQSTDSTMQRWLAAHSVESQHAKTSNMAMSDDATIRVAKIAAAIACVETRDQENGDATSMVLGEMGWVRTRYDRQLRVAAKSDLFLQAFTKVLATCPVTAESPDKAQRATLKAIAITARCLKKTGRSPQELTRWMKAMFKQYNVSAVTYAKQMSEITADRTFHRAVRLAAKQCPELEQETPEAPPVVPVEKTEEEDPEQEDETKEAKAKPEAATYLGPLHGRASGRVSIIISERTLNANIVVGGRHIQATGQVNRRRRVSFAGKSGQNRIQFRGRLSASGNLVRGDYNGTIKAVGQSKTKRVFGLWSAKRKR